MEGRQDEGTGLRASFAFVAAAAGPAAVRDWSARPGLSNICQPGAHEMTENLELASMAVAGDGHTPNFEYTLQKRAVAKVKQEA